MGHEGLRAELVPNSIRKGEMRGGVKNGVLSKSAHAEEERNERALKGVRGEHDSVEKD